MYQAIQTKFLAPTNHRGPRIRATAQAGSVTMAWDYELNTHQNHARAAQALAEKFGWEGAWAGGALEVGYAFVRLPNGTSFADDGNRLVFVR